MSKKKTTKAAKIRLHPDTDPLPLHDKLRELADTILDGKPITEDKQDELTSVLLEAATAIRVYCAIVTHSTIRDWICEGDKERKQLTTDEAGEVIKLFAQSDMECYEMKDMLRSCLDEVIEARKKKGGRRA